MLAKEILIKSLEMIETKGWVKGVGGEGIGYCLLHTIRMSCFGTTHIFSTKEAETKQFTDTPEYVKAIKMLYYQIGKETPWFDLDIVALHSEWAISTWNDEQKRTKEDVVRILKQSIDACE